LIQKTKKEKTLQQSIAEQFSKKNDATTPKNYQNEKKI
jgi:hypothetical protein